MRTYEQHTVQYDSTQQINLEKPKVLFNISISYLEQWWTIKWQNLDDTKLYSTVETKPDSEELRIDFTTLMIP